jgi:ribosomal protein L44E
LTVLHGKKKEGQKDSRKFGGYEDAVGKKKRAESRGQQSTRKLSFSVECTASPQHDPEGLKG